MLLDIFTRLPRPTALLLVSSLLGPSSAHVPRQTPITIPHKQLNVVPYPPVPAPTTPPVDLHTLNELLKRQDTNTICGYVGGDPELPATCLAGSHCVLDAEHNAVGCCPNGDETCSSGVFTGCVDPNSGPQTEVNPYVFTCTGSNVCYKNVFEGGYSQFGCGTASDIGTVVSAAPQITVTSQRISLTQSPSSLATPTELGLVSPTKTTPSASSSPTAATTDTRPSASSPTSEASLTTLTIPSPTRADPTFTSVQASTSTPTSTEAPAASGSGGGVNRTGAIVGGTIAGVAVLAGLLALGILFRRRRAAGSSRRGPRPGDTQYVSPMSGGGFMPVGQNAGSPKEGGQRRAASVRGKTITHITGGPSSHNTVFQTGGVDDYRYPGPNPAPWAGAAGAAGAGAGAGAAAYRGAYASPHDGEDEIPLRYGSPEIDDFSRGYQDALSRIGEEDEEDMASQVNGSGMPGTSNTSGGNGDLGEARPLWLQSRRQSRNQMWT